MSRLVLIKTCKEIQLAHLYEHMFLSAFVEFCRTQKLLDYLDYRWFGRTYHGGFIYIDIVLVSPAAQRLSSNIMELDVKINKKSIEKAVYEINAEKQKRIGANESKLMAELRKLHAKSWQNRGDFLALDLRTLRRSKKVVWDSGITAYTRKLTLEVELNADFASQNRTLLPLFGIVARTILDNISSNLDARCYYFAYKSGSTYSKTIKEVEHLRRWRGSPDSTDELEVCTHAVAESLTNGLVSKTANFLQDARFRKEHILPDELEIYEKCEVLIGDKGWQEAATTDNIMRILEHSTLQVIRGRKRDEIALTD